MKYMTALIFFIFVFLMLFRDYKTCSFNPDEHEYLRKSIYFDLLLKRDFKNELWQYYDSYDQPKLGEYIYGLSLHLGGHKDIARYFQEIGFNEDWDFRIMPYGSLWDKGRWWNKMSGRGLSDVSLELAKKLEPIWQGRKMATMISFLTLIAFFLIGFLYKNYLFGLISTFLLFHNPLFLLCSRQAMGDAPLLFFLLLVFLLSWLFSWQCFKKDNPRKSMLYLFLVGIAIGLAAAVKLNGWMALLYFILYIFLGVGIAALKRKVVYRRDLIWGFLAVFTALLISFLTFILLNPFTWSNPLNKIFMMFYHRAKIGALQQKAMPEYALDTIGERTTFVFKETLLSGGSWVNFKIKDFPLDFILFLWGLVLLLKSFYRGLSRSEYGEKDFWLLLWVGVTFISVMIYIPLNWERYYLPLVPSIALVQDLAIFSFLNFIFEKNKNLL